MADQLATGAEALRLFFTDDVFLVDNNGPAEIIVNPVDRRPEVQIAEVNTADVQVAEVNITGVKIAEVQVAEVQIAEAKPAARAFTYLGKNQKNVLILVNDPGNDVSTENGRELLRNLVKALQLTANDFALLNFARYEQLQFAELHSFFSCRLVLAFGILPTQLGLAEQPQYVISTHESVQFVFSGNLDQLSADLEGKKKLWGSLKQIQI